MILKSHDRVTVIDNEDIIRPYLDESYAGKSGVIVSRGNKNGYDGWEIEFTTSYGFKSIEFVRADHVIASPSKTLSNQKARWEEVADAWQKKLWQDKMKEE
mgnify:FL=1